MIWISASAAVLLLAGAGVWLGAWALAALRRRYAHLLAAVELLQRQATELRAEIDRLRELALRAEERLARLEPEIGRLARGLELEAAAEAVRRAEASERLRAATASHVLAHLCDLGEANAARGETWR
jgi:hypothetical protein